MPHCPLPFKVALYKVGVRRLDCRAEVINTMSMDMFCLGWLFQRDRPAPFVHTRVKSAVKRGVRGVRVDSGQDPGSPVRPVSQVSPPCGSRRQQANKSDLCGASPGVARRRPRPLLATPS